MNWLTITPMTGPLETRLMPDQTPWGGWRKRVNFDAIEEGKLRRSPGWVKPLAHAEYTESENQLTNTDLHDQLLPLAGGQAIRLPIVFLREYDSSAGATKLLAATRETVYAYNESTRNWQVIGGGYGGTGSFWQMAKLGDTVVATNNYDEVQAWEFGAPPPDNYTNAMQPLAALQELGITRAACVAEWKGLMFLANVVDGGKTMEHQILWCAYHDLNAWDAGVAGTTAGFQLLDPGERIMALCPMGNYLLAYTNKSIWQATVVGDENLPLNFQQLYISESGDACLALPNTLLNLGDAHLYMGLDGVYLFDPSQRKPERVAWIHSATREVFSTLDVTKCGEHVSGYDPRTKTAYFSWVKKDGSRNETLAVNLISKTASFLDHGFTAFARFQPNGRSTLRDFLSNFCICDYPTLAVDTENGAGFVREGVPVKVQDTGCASGPTCLHTTVTKTDSALGVTCEDYDVPTASEGSFCMYFKKLGITRMEDLCRKCQAPAVFLGASATDYCLKEMGDEYRREMLAGTPAAGTFDYWEDTETALYHCGRAAYTDSGYHSELMSGPLHIQKWFDSGLEEVTVKGLELEVEVEDDTGDPAELALSVGVSASAADPALESGLIRWQKQTVNRRYLKQLRTGGAETRPHLRLRWPLLLRGRYLYVHLKVAKTNGEAPTAAVVRLSRMSIGV